MLFSGTCFQEQGFAMNLSVPNTRHGTLCSVAGCLMLLSCFVNAGGESRAGAGTEGSLYNISDKHMAEGAGFPGGSYTTLIPEQNPSLSRAIRSLSDTNYNNFDMVFRCTLIHAFSARWSSEGLFPAYTHTGGDPTLDPVTQGAATFLLLSFIEPTESTGSLNSIDTLLFINTLSVIKAINARGGQPVSIQCHKSTEFKAEIQIARPGPGEVPEPVISSNTQDITLEYFGPSPRDQSGCLADYSDPGIVLDDIYSLNPAGRFAPKQADHVVTMDISGGHDEVRSLLSIPVAGQSSAIIVTGHAVNVARNGMERTLDDFVILRLYPNGQTDHRFGHGGGIFYDQAKGVDRILTSADLGDGTFLIAGSSTNGAVGSNGGNHKDMVIQRYTTNGKPVTDVGKFGTIIRDFAGGDDEVRALGVFTDNNGVRNIVAAGYVTNDARKTVARILRFGYLR